MGHDRDDCLFVVEKKRMLWTRGCRENLSGDFVFLGALMHAVSSLSIALGKSVEFNTIHRDQLQD